MTKRKPSSAKSAIRNCHFQYRCHKEWDELTVTEQEEVRFCSECSKNVYFCEDRFALARAIAKNHCVAIPSEFIATYTHENASPLLDTNDRRRGTIGVPARLDEPDEATRKVLEKRKAIMKMVLRGKFTGDQIQYILRDDLDEVEQIEFIESVISQMVNSELIDKAGAMAMTEKIKDAISQIR